MQRYSIIKVLQKYCKLIAKSIVNVLGKHCQKYCKLIAKSIANVLGKHCQKYCKLIAKSIVKVLGKHCQKYWEIGGLIDYNSGAFQKLDLFSSSVKPYGNDP